MTDDTLRRESLPIAAVERDCGVSKDTLRAWERRYGFPRPTRNEHDERMYPADQVERLRAIRRLLDLGHRPRRIVGLELDELNALVRANNGTAAPADGREPASAQLDAFVELVESRRIEELQRRLSQCLLRIGLARFTVEVVAPLNRVVGDGWARGRLEIFEEHLYTESIQTLLRNAIHSMPQTAASPRVLLTTLPPEQHGLGLLMAQAILALEGVHCISLGVHTPLGEIANAAQTHRVDIVALSFSTGVNQNQALDGLAQLRGRLASGIELWAGGSCSALYRRTPAGVTALRELIDIGPAVAHWRAAHGAAG